MRPHKTPPVLVTGAAGFIGYHTAAALLAQGYSVVGLDNLNDYYSPALKRMRLDRLATSPQAAAFTFVQGDLSDAAGLKTLFEIHRFATVINLAAQAGVRYSLTNPEAYVRSNLEGFVNVLEASRRHEVGNLIFASSSSVYGLNSAMPFSEGQNVDHPISLYAASKKSNELIAHSYAHLFRLPVTGLRFFTVYGPWGRPDMAMFLFANAILDGKPLRLFNDGKLQRDFTYVDDVVESLVRLVERPATSDPAWHRDDPTPCTSSAPYRIYNIGNHSPVVVRELVAKMEAILGRSAQIVSEPMQAGDVEATFADVERLSHAVDFVPKTSIDDGLRRFLDWLLWYRKQGGKA